MTMRRDSKYLKIKDGLDIDFTNCKQVMSSNLPLLFANGQPRSLETISQPELEEFVPFMVRCSLGTEAFLKPKLIHNCPAPEWWPHGLPFKFPLVEQNDWMNRLVMLKSLVCRCYTFYNCEFLLKFSSELADMPPSQLRFEKSGENSTAIFDANGSLLVKCRNENLNYDIHKNPRRYLSPAHRSSLNQAKKFESVIDLTFDTSSEDEKEVYFKETVPPASRKAGKRKTSVEQSEETVSAKRRCLRLFNDFPLERPEPTTYNQEQFMEKFQLIPLGRDIPREMMRVERKKRLSKSFSILSISSRRGQELLTKSRHSFNVESSLSRIERFCGPEWQEETETGQVYTRAAATFSAMFKKDEVNKPEDQTIAETEKDGTEGKWCHSYKWVHRTNNPVYPYQGPCVKPCTVTLNKLSQDELNLYLANNKSCTKSTMTPEEWWSDELAICKCQLISVNLEDQSYLGGKTYNKMCSTQCTCGSSQAHYLPPPLEKYFLSEIKTNNKEMYEASRQACSTKSCSNSCSTGYSDSSSESEQPCNVFEKPMPLSLKRAAYRKPLAVVPPMPSTVSRPAASDLMSPPAPQPPPHSQHTSSTASIKANFTRSILDAIKWYSKDEVMLMGDSLEEAKIIDPSQENIKPTTELTLPNFIKPIDYFQQNLNEAEYDYCYKRTSDGSSKLVTRRGERHYFNREPCPSCFQGRNNFCVYEFVRQAKLAGLGLQENQKHLHSWFFKFITSVKRN